MTITTTMINAVNVINITAVSEFGVPRIVRVGDNVFVTDSESMIHESRDTDDPPFNFAGFGMVTMSNDYHVESYPEGSYISAPSVAEAVRIVGYAAQGWGFHTDTKYDLGDWADEDREAQCDVLCPSCGSVDNGCREIGVCCALDDVICTRIACDTPKGDAAGWKVTFRCGVTVEVIHPEGHLLDGWTTFRDGGQDLGFNPDILSRSVAVISNLENLVWEYPVDSTGDWVHIEEDFIAEIGYLGDS